MHPPEATPEQAAQPTIHMAGSMLVLSARVKYDRAGIRMSKKRKRTAEPSPQQVSPPPALPTIHEAECASGASGVVEYGPEIDLTTAVARRQAGGNVVVRGDDINANRRLAEQIETAVGPCKRGEPHRLAGPCALPHYQPHPRPPAGHAFYETPRRKARKKP